MKRTILIAAVIVVLAGISLFGLKLHLRQIDCKRRDEAFVRREKTVEQDAHTQLTIGTKKTDVARFFVDHGIPLTIVKGEAIGTLYTTGCSPFGCGADSAIITIHVGIDTEGTITGESNTVGGYTDCL